MNFYFRTKSGIKYIRISSSGEFFMKQFILFLKIFFCIAFFNACSKTESNSPASQPLPTIVNDKEPVAPESTDEVIKAIQEGFINLSCKSVLKPKAQQLDQKGVLFDASVNCNEPGSEVYIWQIDRLYEQLSKITEKISLLRDRKDVHQTDLNMVNAISSATSGLLNDTKKFKENYDQNLKLVNALSKGLECDLTNAIYSDYECPSSALDKFAALYEKLFANVEVGALPIDTFDLKKLRKMYLPLQKLRGLLKGFEKLFNAKYPETFSFKSGEKPNEKGTSIAFWTSFNLSNLFTNSIIDDFDRPAMSAVEIRNVMNNIFMLAEHGDALVKGLNAVHQSSWLDVRFDTDQKIIRQVNIYGVRFFAKLHRPMSLESLSQEARDLDQIAIDLKTAFDRVNALRPDLVKVWDASYGFDGLDGEDYPGGITVNHAKEITTLVNGISAYIKEVDELTAIAKENGKELVFSFGVRSSTKESTKYQINTPALGPENKLVVFVELPRNANLVSVFSNIKSLVTKKLKP